MLVKLYWTLWIVTLVASIAFFISGSFTMLVAVVFGFTLFGLVFMGMVSVLPSTVGHNATQENREVQIEPQGVLPDSAFITDRVYQDGTKVHVPIH